MGKERVCVIMWAGTKHGGVRCILYVLQVEISCPYFVHFRGKDLYLPAGSEKKDRERRVYTKMHAHVRSYNWYVNTIIRIQRT